MNRIVVESDLHLRRKFTFLAHGQKAVFVKKPVESTEHVLMKAFLWALYLPQYPNLSIEVDIGYRYKPDLVDIDSGGIPLFWGEAGRVGARKMHTLVSRYHSTHFVFAKWNARLTPYAKQIEKAAAVSSRRAPVDLISFPVDSGRRFIDHQGRLLLDLADVSCQHFASPASTERTH